MTIPTFIIAGAQKSGTTALSNYLGDHPEITLSSFKEVHYFDYNIAYKEGVKWYEKHFHKENKSKAIGEATPDYMYMPYVPQRIYNLLPNIKLIFLLRNPVDRAYSHYWHEVKFGWEKLSFEEAISIEKKRILKNKQFKRHYSYLDRGKYIIQLDRFLKYFNKKQVLILNSNDLKNKRNETICRVFNFIDVDSSFKINNHEKKYLGKAPRIKKIQRLFHKNFSSIPNSLMYDKSKIEYYFYKSVCKSIDFFNLKNGYPDMEDKTREYLENYFEKYNNSLEKKFKIVFS